MHRLTRLTRLLVLPLFFTGAPAMAECVVLLHGLARSGYSMLALQEALAFQGYRVINETYASENAPIAEMVAHVGAMAARCEGERVNFVTHSLGGILTRAWLRNNRPANMGRVVMLAPPNRGTEVVDALAGSGNEMVTAMLDFFGGRTAYALGTDAHSLPNLLGPVNFELGVIAGDRAISPLGPILIEGPNDGTVSVESTRIEGMRDHIVLPTTHTTIMNSPKAMAQVLTFLETGRFEPGMTLTEAVRLLATRPAEAR